MDKYNIGQRLIVNEDVETEGCAFKVPHKIRKGTRMYVGADNFIHFLDTSMMPTKTPIEGYSVKGISEFIYEMVSARIPLDEMLEDYDIDKSEFMGQVADALEELGFWDNTGNRS